MMSKSLRIPVFMLVATAALPASAQQAWNIGDPVPPLPPLTYVKGDPVDLAKEIGKRAVMIEFWATWCRPCKESIPKLTQHQAQYKDSIAIIGITVPDPGNTMPMIRSFVAQKGDLMNYAVAVDETGSIHQTHYLPSGGVGVPFAFIIDKKGKLAWKGSPLDDNLDTILGQIADGSFDANSAGRVSQIKQDLIRPKATGQWPAVLSGYQQILELDPMEEEAMSWVFHVCVDKLQNGEALEQFSRNHLDRNRGRADVLIMLSEYLLNTNKFGLRYPDVALDAARSAYDLTKNAPNAMARHWYARALYDVGKLDQALALQQEAFTVATPAEMPSIQEALQYYQRCKRAADKSKDW